MERKPNATNPVRQLIDEHEIFMEALTKLVDAMAFAGERVEERGGEASGESHDQLPPGVMATIDEVWHAVNEHLNVHFVKEEEIFFPFIERMIPGSRVKFQFLHVDHDRLRDCFEEFTETIQDYRYRGPSRERVERLRQTASEMSRWFYYHIIAEDAVYFDIAERELSEEESRTVLERMREVEGRLREYVEPSPKEGQSVTSKRIP